MASRNPMEPQVTAPREAATDPQPADEPKPATDARLLTGLGLDDRKRFVRNFMVLVCVPAGFGILFGLRIFRLVVVEPMWVYGALFVVSEILVYAVRLWDVRNPNPRRFYVQMFSAYSMCTLIVYMTGWGPELMIAFLTVGVVTIVMHGSRYWKACLAFNCFFICLGQVLVAVHLAPSKLPVAWAEALALMGFFLLLLTLRLVAFSVERSEHTALLLQRSEARFAHWALHDSLTGLPNRRQFLERLQEVMEGGRRRTDGDLPAIFYLDLDKFKEVNDQFGHAAGDTLLVDLAGRMSEVIRDGDLLARLGGDEFVVLRDSVPDNGTAETMAERLLKCVEEPFLVAGRDYRIGMSVGIAVARSGSDAEDVLEQADRAMYLAKSERDTHMSTSAGMRGGTG